MRNYISAYALVGALTFQVALAAELAAAAVDRVDPVTLLTQRIEETKQQRIARPSALSEAYTDLWSALEGAGQHAEAAAAASQGVQDLRSLTGLYDPMQLPLIERSIVSNEALENWDALEAANLLKLNVVTRAYPAGNTTRFQQVLAIGEWKARAAANDLVSGYVDRELQASYLLEKEIAGISLATDYLEKRIQIASLKLGIARAEHLMAEKKWKMPVTDFAGGGGPQYTRVQTCTPQQRSSTFVINTCQPIDVPNLNNYFIPTQRKNMEIMGHMSTMKDSILAAYEVLQTEAAMTTERDKLLEEVQLLTASYNGLAEQFQTSPATGTPSQRETREAGAETPGNAP